MPPNKIIRPSAGRQIHYVRRHNSAIATPNRLPQIGTFTTSSSAKYTAYVGTLTASPRRVHCLRRQTYTWYQVNSNCIAADVDAITTPPIHHARRSIGTFIMPMSTRLPTCTYLGTCTTSPIYPPCTHLLPRKSRCPLARCQKSCR